MTCVQSKTGEFINFTGLLSSNTPTHLPKYLTKVSLEYLFCYIEPYSSKQGVIHRQLLDWTVFLGNIELVPTFSVPSLLHIH